MKTWTSRAAAAAACLLLIPAALAAQVELTVGYGTCTSAWKDASYLHAYTPRFLYGTPAVTSAQQTLSLGADSAGGGSIGLAFVRGAFGIQASYLWFSPDVIGTSSDHTASVAYTTLQPPDYTPVPVSLNFSSVMPDPAGQLSESVLNLNGFVRLPLVQWFSLDLSAGASWFMVNGEIGTLDYLKFWLGGHSTLMFEEYGMLMRVQPANRIGWNAGTTLNWHMGSNASLWLDVRYYKSGAFQPELTFEVIDAESSVMAFDPAEDVIPAGRLLLDPSFFRIAGGFRINL